MRFIAAIILFFSFQAHADRFVSNQAHLDITTDKIVHIPLVITQESLPAFAYELGVTSELPGDRVVIINSMGGEVHDGQLMIDHLLKERALNHSKLICIVDRAAHSMAFNLLSFCDIRLATGGSRMVMHDIAFARLTEENNGRLTAIVLLQLAMELARSQVPYTIQNAKALNMSVDDTELFSSEEHNFTAQELLERGYLAGLMDSRITQW